MCGSTSQQKDIEQQQQAFFQNQTAAYNTVFGQSQGILSALTSTFQSMLAAGPGQEGFTPAEKAARTTVATEGVGNEYAKASQALGEQRAARGGGNEFLPSGADEQAKQELASAGAAQSSTMLNNITAEDYATGRQNFFGAAQALGSTAAQLNPVGYSGAATGAGNAAANTANQIATAENAWMGPVFGALGGIAGAAIPHIPGMSGGGGGG